MNRIYSTLSLQTTPFIRQTRLSVKQRPSISRSQSTATPQDFQISLTSSTDVDIVTLDEQLAVEGSSIRAWCPLIESNHKRQPTESLPLMFFFSDLDGSGWSGSGQFSRLMQVFDFVSFTIPLDDDRPFDDLVEEMVEVIRFQVRQSNPMCPVYLLGDAFGALFVLAIAAQCAAIIDRLILINPATSYSRSFWPFLEPLIQQLPDEIYQTTASLVSPLIKNFPAFTDPSFDLLPEQLDVLFKAVMEGLKGLGVYGEFLTRTRVARRFNLIKDGIQQTTPFLSTIPQRTLLLTSDADWILPSSEENERLSNIMRRCHGRSLGMKRHGVLQDMDLDLVEIIKEEGFYVTERRFTSATRRPPNLNAFGKPEPIDLPTEIERKRTAERYTFINRATSPVFFHTDDNTSRVVQGLPEALQTRPVLLVGNHQLMAQDMFTLVDHILKEQGILFRGLAHPVLLNNGEEELERKPGGILLGPMGGQKLLDVLQTFGAVQVHPASLYKLLKMGERVLLYPGGTRESFKLKNETYKLFWPEKAEFVRMAAKFNATIITVASVGAEECFEIVLDKTDLLRLPFLGNFLRDQIQRTPKPRSDGDASIPDAFLPPLIRPNVPHRQYFLFGKPIATTTELYRDRPKAHQLYKQIEQQLKTDIDYLITKSKEDPYGDFFRRMLYENATHNKTAPTFEP